MISPTTVEATPNQQPQKLTVPEHVIILAATALICAAILQAEPLQSANDRSRWATVWSLVERGSFQIDEIDYYARWSTIDKVRYRTSESEPWHFYSSKPPLLSVIVAGLYSVERWTLGYGLFNHTALVTRLLLLIVNALPFWIALRSLVRCLILLNAALPARLFILAAAGFGSMLNPYLTTLNNHTPAAAAAMFAISAAVEILVSRNRARSGTNAPAQNGRTFAALGFFAALTCCFELPAALLGLLSFGLAVLTNLRLTLKWYIPAATLPLAAFFITNWMATGGVKPFYATYGTETYRYVHNGIPSYWMNPRDLDANQESPVVYLFHCVLGHHGLLSLTPVLCLSFVGCCMILGRNSETLRKASMLSGAALTAITLGFYLTRTENYNYGGNSVGLRWMLWLSPFWWIAMVPVLENLSRRSFQILALTLLLISMVSVGCSLNRPWKPSWLFEQMQSAGWINYRTPVKPFDPPRTSVFTMMPDTAGTSATWRNGNGERLIVTAIENSAPATGQQESTPNGLAIRVDLESGGTRTVIQNVVSESLTPQKSPAQKLDSPAFDLAKAVEVFAVEVLANQLPLKTPFHHLPSPAGSWSGYNAAGTKWVPSISDPTRAWQVERGAARVLVDDPFWGKCWHRCDVMYCDQLPFGVLEWKTTVISETTGEVLSTETWVAEQK